MMPKKWLVLGAFMIGATATSPSHAQNVVAYPARGQSQAKHNHDCHACHSWAVQQSGYDPSRSQSQPLLLNGASPLRGAARGAAVGAVGGAIGGNAVRELRLGQRRALSWAAYAAAIKRDSSNQRLRSRTASTTGPSGHACRVVAIPWDKIFADEILQSPGIKTRQPPRRMQYFHSPPLRHIEHRGRARLSDGRDRQVCRS